MTMRTYISGPMTGIADFNRPAFAAEAAKLRAMGVEVINPAEHGEDDPTMQWSDYLRKDIRLLMDCNAIHMLPGWTKSKGAMLEYHIATKLGYSITGALR
jgi:hypothetical protein